MRHHRPLRSQDEPTPREPRDGPSMDHQGARQCPGEDVGGDAEQAGPALAEVVTAVAGGGPCAGLDDHLIGHLAGHLVGAVLEAGKGEAGQTGAPEAGSIPTMVVMTPPGCGW